MLSNQEIITVGGEEYTLTLTRKGITAIEKYTSLSKKKVGNISLTIISW